VDSPSQDSSKSSGNICESSNPADFFCLFLLIHFHGRGEKRNHLESFCEVVSKRHIGHICWTVVLILIVCELVAAEVLLRLNHLLLEKRLDFVRVGRVKQE
jgi:hypothetical protein